MLQNMSRHVVQSPARVGLPNPTSPSLQNPQPKLPQIPQSHQTLLPPTSSTLLSLFPPLSRAQTLLLQMAMLASKLFEVSPNRSAWLNSLRGSFPTFLSSQTVSAPALPLDSTPNSTKDVLTLFTSLQTQLFEAVAELQEILDLQDAKQKIAREIQSMDSAIFAFSNKLKEAERMLDILVDDYSDYRHAKVSKTINNVDGGDESSSTTVASQLKLSDILSYAHRISYTTFAPPEFGAGQAPLRGALPPAPQEEQLRASQLYNFSDLDIGLPKPVEGNEKIIEALIEPPVAPPLEESPLTNLPSIQGLIPQNITVPTGWKPGMPVELPKDLPMPPPGWKPGDPIMLPPLDSIPVLGRVEEDRPRPVAAPVFHKVPEPIQVRPVQLDITMDQDDDSDEYSSEEASSDDED